MLETTLQKLAETRCAVTFEPDEIAEIREALKVITPEWLDRKMAWSYETFGPGMRLDGVLDHISEEMEEVRKEPADTKEWVDIILLAIDGAMRQGATGKELVDAILAKQERNLNREWPDWRTQSANHRIKAIK